MDKKDTVAEVKSHEEAVQLANEINRLEAAAKAMKDQLKKYVEENGSVDTGQEVWGFYESVSWNFDKQGLKEVARNIAIEGLDPWELLTLPKPKLTKLGWDEQFLSQMGKKNVTQRFTSRKTKTK